VGGLAQGKFRSTVLIVLEEALPHNHDQASMLEFTLHKFPLISISNNHLFLREPPPSTFYTVESNRSHPSSPLDISSSHAETIGKVGLSGRVLLLRNVGAQNIEHGRNLGQDESL
jgi:hypothetical protein